MTSSYSRSDGVASSSIAEWLDMMAQIFVPHSHVSKPQRRLKELTQWKKVLSGCIFVKASVLFSTSATPSTARESVVTTAAPTPLNEAT
jgi:hypothetical protein